MAQQTVNIGTYEKQNHILDMIKDLNPMQKVPRYTVKIDKNNPSPSGRITYMHDAVGMTPASMNYSTGKFSYGDWASMWFIRDNYPVMLKSNGMVDYKLAKSNHAYKEDGTTASDVGNTSYDGNAMSRFPLVWTAFWEDGNYEYISICEQQYDDTYSPIGFVNDKGEIQSETFLAMYQGSLVGSKLRSLSGQWPIMNKTATEEIAAAQANGANWYTRTWAQRQMVNALLTIISKSDDSQTAFGGGVYNTYDPQDAHYGMKIAGGLNDKGQFMGYNDGTHQVKVFFIEDWWGNQWERIAGVINNNGTMRIAMHGPYDTTGEGASYKTIEGATPSGTNGGYIARCKVHNDCGRLPISTQSPSGQEGSSSTFLADQFYFINISSEIDYFFCGGFALSPNGWAGMHTFDISSTPSRPDYIGASLSYIAS